MKAAFLSIGDEIVGGLTVDTNSGFIAGELRAVGVDPICGFTVRDEEDDIIRALEQALREADLVVTTGGLGPTADDLTTACVARHAGQTLVLDEPSLAFMIERFRQRGMEMPPNNRKQALFPASATVIPNPNGTAPGFICPVEVDGRTRHVACFPGVPRETRHMVMASLVPWVAARQPDTRFLSRTFSTVGLAESKLDELLAGAISPDEARVAFRASFPKMYVRLTVQGAPGEDLEARMDELEARVHARLGAAVYAVGDEGMEETLGRMLRERGLTLAVAESCTGGLIGDRLTNVPGSSEYFLLGVAAYSNGAKMGVLGVSEQTLAAHGAVSTQTAEEMAAGARRAGGADVGLSTTGIAGPGGGTADKPVGTVCIGLAWEGGTWSRRFDLGSRGREWIKATTAQMALDSVRRWLLGEL
ncbi:competence/damage-inducible protein A [Longimicrobium sp.]|uniref:competence/damage-inducible protein A n=1 Tax=Longimicrobium sp. TaxID=2029185 RepID=UPI002E32FF8E|nr:competence/damage-inducible protein A [Longimicrobium sp.]HEX6039190.1 competence/damage-inducible protein A [Longimicrobium sp.]